MRTKCYWALSAFVVLFVIGAAVVHIDQRVEIKQLKEEKVEADKLLEEHMKKKAQSLAKGESYVDYSKPPPGKTFANGGHWHGDEWHDAPHNEVLNDLGSYSQTAPADSISTLNHSSISTLNHSSDKIAELKKQIGDINERVQAKYPELQDLAFLTPEGIHTRYPADSDKLALAQKAEDYFDEFLLEIKHVFAEAPIEIRKNVFDEIRNQLVSNLGEEIADATISVIQDLVKK